MEWYECASRNRNESKIATKSTQLHHHWARWSEWSIPVFNVQILLGGAQIKYINIRETHGLQITDVVRLF